MSPRIETGVYELYQHGPHGKKFSPWLLIVDVDWLVFITDKEELLNGFHHHKSSRFNKSIREILDISFMSDHDAQRIGSIEEITQQTALELL